MSIKLKTLPSATVPSPSVPTSTKGDTKTTFKATPPESSTLDALLKCLSDCQETIEWTEKRALVAIAFGDEGAWAVEKWQDARKQAKLIEAKLQSLGLKPE